MSLEEQFAAARQRIWQAILRKVNFAARSKGQRKRREREDNERKMNANQ